VSKLTDAIIYRGANLHINWGPVGKSHMHAKNYRLQWYE